MAFSVVHSLLHTIEGLLDSCCISLASSTREILQSARVHASSLESKINCCSEGVTEMDELKIIEKARKLQDAIEFPLSTLFLPLSESGEGCSPTFKQLREDVDCFAKTAKEMEENIEELWQQKAARMIEGYIKELFVPKEEDEVEEVSSECDMVGLSDQFLLIREMLAPQVTEYMFPVEMVVWISGMAGIGTTMLAKKIYHDPWVKANFQCRAFVRVGQEFRIKEVLQAIATQLNLDDVDEDLSGCLFRISTLRNSLIVLDDVWDYTFLDLLKKKLDFVYSETRILVTSWTDVDPWYYGVDILKMRFMNEEESWELLRRNVFGDLECPPQLVKVGKKIAEKCEGLPLLIVAVAPILLSKAQKNVEDWSRVAEKPRSVLEDAYDKILEVLLSSYHRLTEDSKLCFLYIAAFPLSYIVRCSRITNLWCAERFTYLHFIGTLHMTNLVTVHQKCRNWWVRSSKACRLHCAYWYVSRRVAKNNKFLYTIDNYEDGLDKCVESHRRLAIYKNVMFAIKEVHNKIASIQTVRSLLCTGPYHQYQVPICWEWRLLRILDALSIRYYEFPIEVVKLIRLRYLALTCNADLPPSISKLWSLEFLIVHQHVSIKQVVTAESYVPVDIWDMQELQHLEIIGRNLPDPPHPGAVLPNLLELLGVGVQSCTKAVLGSIPKLKKLRIQIELAPNIAAEIFSGFDHISCLRELESLQSVVMNPTLLRPPPPLSIPASHLKKLSLIGFGYPWEDMRKIAHLPYLEVLKLQSYAFRGEKWEAEEMGLWIVEYLLIEDTDLVQWTARDGTNFKRLRQLRMKNCHKLREIPYFGSSLIIELVDCNPSAETFVKQHQSRLVMDGTVRVTANYSWKEEKGVKTL